MRGSTRTRKSRHILNADGPMASMQSAQMALSTPSSISQAPAPSSSTARPPNSPGTTSSRIPSSGNAQPVMRANTSSTTTYSQTTPSAATSRRGSLQRPSSRARRSSTSRRCPLHDLRNREDGVLSRLDLEIAKVNVVGRRAHAAKHEGVAEDFHAINYSPSAAHAVPITATMSSQCTQTRQET